MLRNQFRNPRTSYMIIFLSMFASVLPLQSFHAASVAEVQATPLLNQSLHNIDGKDLLVLELTLDPGASSPAHKHPGHVVGYVIEGSYEVQLDDGETSIFNVGETFYEPEGVVHTVGKNPSDSKSARIIVFMIKQEGQPVTSFVNP